jgi:hypothetical protein
MDMKILLTPPTKQQIQASLIRPDMKIDQITFCCNKIFEAINRSEYQIEYLSEEPFVNAKFEPIDFCPYCGSNIQFLIQDCEVAY